MINKKLIIYSFLDKTRVKEWKYYNRPEKSKTLEDNYKFYVKIVLGLLFTISFLIALFFPNINILKNNILIISQILAPIFAIILSLIFISGQISSKITTNPLKPIVFSAEVLIYIIYIIFSICFPLIISNNSNTSLIRLSLFFLFSSLWLFIPFLVFITTIISLNSVIIRKLENIRKNFRYFFYINKEEKLWESEIYTNEIQEKIIDMFNTVYNSIDMREISEIRASLFHVEEYMILFINDTINVIRDERDENKDYLFIYKFINIVYEQYVSIVELLYKLKLSFFISEYQESFIKILVIPYKENFKLMSNIKEGESRNRIYYGKLKMSKEKGEELFQKYLN